MSKKPCNFEVYVRHNDINRAIKQFTKKTKKSGIIQEILDRRYYKSKSKLRREMKKRFKRKRSQENNIF